jgi:1A family penicillin-binding protein
MNIKKTLWKYSKSASKFVRRHEILVKNFILILLIVGIFSGGGFLLWAASLKTPDINSFDTRLAGISTKIYDRTGNVLLYDVNSQVRRTVVPYTDISNHVKNASIAIEDTDFYNHNGIRFSSIVRAFFANIFSGGFSQGGSTITQQVIKNSLLTQDKKVSRKIKEWILALKLERVATKDEILNLYLNTTPYGGNIYGIEEASIVYFGKKASELDIAESAYLAALPQAPSYYSPFGRNREALNKRKNLVLDRMHSNNFINDDQYKKAKEEQVVFKDAPINTLKAPHFVMYVKEYLENKYGEAAVAEGGLKVITTLDYEMEKMAEDIVKNYVTKNEKAFKAENGALVVVNPKNGHILTMVGSRDYFDKNIDGNFNVTTAFRQPGSAFKPFVYTTLLDKGYTPNTILFDVRTEFSTSCSANSVPLRSGVKCYAPQNYEGGYKGPMTIRAALGESRNIPAVKALYLAGIPDVIKTSKAMGIESLKEPRAYGLSMAIGAADVSLLEMTDGYATLANNGFRNPATPIIRIEDKNGNILEEFSTSTKQVINERPVLEMNDILSDPRARNAIFPLSYIPDGRPVAIKTGTTNDSRDAWIMGYTPSLAVGAWMGNNNNSPMVQRASAIIVAPMWKQFLLEIIKAMPVEDFKKAEPEDDSNLKPVLRGIWQNGNGFSGYNVHTILHWVNKDDPRGDPPRNPASDPQYHLWEYGVQNWAFSQGFTGFPTEGEEDPSNPGDPLIEDSLNPPGPEPTGRESQQGNSQGATIIIKKDQAITQDKITNLKEKNKKKSG